MALKSSTLLTSQLDISGLTNLLQRLNMQYVFVREDVVHFETSSPFKTEQFWNIFFMDLTFDTSQSLTSNEVRTDQVLKAFCMLVTLLTSQLPTSTVCKAVQLWNKYVISVTLPVLSKSAPFTAFKLVK